MSILLFGVALYWLAASVLSHVCVYVYSYEKEDTCLCLFVWGGGYMHEEDTWVCSSRKVRGTLIGIPILSTKGSNTTGEEEEEEDLFIFNDTIEEHRRAVSLFFLRTVHALTLSHTHVCKNTHAHNQMWSRMHAIQHVNPCLRISRRLSQKELPDARVLCLDGKVSSQVYAIEFYQLKKKLN